MEEISWIFYLVGFILIINIFVSYKLFKSDSYDKKQKVFQFIIIYLLPIIGAYLIWYFLKDEYKEDKNPYGGGVGRDHGVYSGSSIGGGD